MVRYAARSATVIFAVPTSIPRYTCMASAFTTSPRQTFAQGNGKVGLAGRGGTDDRDDE